MNGRERALRALKGEAGGYGFEPITHAAAEVEESIRGGAAPPDIRPKLSELVRRCLAARPTSCANGK